MEKFRIEFTRPALRDMRLLSAKSIKKLQKVLLEKVAENPYSGKKLIAEMEGQYSYRLNLKDRLLYWIDPNSKTVYVHRVRTHYGE